MSLVVDNYDSKTYSLVINSNDKILGTNNNATYQVNWQDFLPEEFDSYKIMFSFQTAGGYYSDGVTQIPTASNGTGLNYKTSTSGSAISTSANLAIGSASMTVNTGSGSLVSGSGLANQFVICYNANTTNNCFPAGTTITYGSLASGAGTVYFSNPCIYPILTGATIYVYSSTLVNTVNYSSARILLNTSSTSYSFDTSTKAPSLNLGVAQRDIQTSQSKSNTLSTFYCQVPPRCIARPSNNFLQVQIFNNAVFAGGITSYNGTTPLTYSTAATNQNFLTDTDQLGTQITLSNDMTAYNLILEFVPLLSSKRKSRFDV
jgi:hypothetical protein